MDEQQNSKQELRRIETRAFAIVLETIAIFGVPALLAALIGKAVFPTNTGVYILLAVAFVLSWVILLVRLKKIMRDLEEARKRVHKGVGGQERGSK